MPTKTNKASVSVRMPADMYQALKILANAEERSLSKQIIYALGEWMQMKRDEEDEGQGASGDVLRDGVMVDGNIRWSAVPVVISDPLTGGVSMMATPGQSPSVPQRPSPFQASPSDSYSISPSASPSPSASESPSANPSAMETFRKWYNDNKPQGDE